MRIVSLLPSATEIVHAVGLGSSLVGVTHECDFPPEVSCLPKVTRTLIPPDASSAEIDGLVRDRLRTRRALYELDLPVLEALRPDLIVTQALCDVCAVDEEDVREAACRLPGKPRIVNLEPTNLAEVLASLVQVGRAADTLQAAERAVAAIERRLAPIRTRAAGTPPVPLVLLEWIDPLFCAGHWSPELLALAGADERIGRPGARSRTISPAELAAASPEVLLLACCGFTVDRTLQDVPALRRLPCWRELPAVRNGRVFAVDGSAYFSRPGPRLVDGIEIVAHALFPAVHPLPPGLAPAYRLSAEELHGP